MPPGHFVARSGSKLAAQAFNFSPDQSSLARTRGKLPMQTQE
jgi:hypothetical protein